MKKVLSLLLAALMLFSCCGVMAFAADGDEIKEPITVTFKYYVLTFDENGVANGVEYKELNKTMEKGAAITNKMMNTWLDEMPKQVGFDYQVEEDYTTRTETKTYTFKYFTAEGFEDGERLTFEGSVSEISEPTVFIAQYNLEDTIDYVTFWEFVQSIFARINKIFEYFAAIFGF